MTGRIKPYERQGKRVIAWQVVLELGKGVDGKRQRWTDVVRGTKAEAEQVLAQKRAEVMRGEFVPRHSMTVAEWLGVWLADYAPNRASTYTLEGYARIVKQHITPALGSLKLTDLSTPAGVEAVQRLYTRQKDKGLAPRTVLRTHYLLNSALRRAVRIGRLAWNPCDRVELPTPGKHNPKALDASGAVVLLEKLEGSELHIPALLAVYCGLRRGEVLALSWECVDLETCRLRVERACDPSKANRGKYKAPKSEAGRRVVPFPPNVQAALRAHKQAQADLRKASRQTVLDAMQGKPLDKVRAAMESAYCDSGLVVSRPDGEPWDSNRFSNAWTAAKKDKGLGVSFHELRHSYASHLASLGVPIDSARALMGHADASTTQRVYVHTLPGALESAVDLLAASIQSATPAKKAGTV